MPIKINQVFKAVVLFSSCSVAFAQTFMGIEQSKSLQLQKYQAPSTAIQPMTSQDFKGAVGSMSEQTQNTISQNINKKLLPPPEPLTKAPTTPANQETATESTPTTTTTTPQQTPPTAGTLPTTAPATINNQLTAPASSNIAPANTAPASSTPVYSGFQGSGNTNANTSGPRGGSNNNAPAKSSGWNINY